MTWIDSNSIELFLQGKRIIKCPFVLLYSRKRFSRKPELSFDVLNSDHVKLKKMNNLFYSSLGIKSNIEVSYNKEKGLLYFNTVIPEVSNHLDKDVKPCLLIAPY